MKFGSFSLDNENVRMGLIVLAAVVVLYFIYRHSKPHTNEDIIDKIEQEFFENANVADPPTEDPAQSQATQEPPMSQPNNDSEVMPAEAWGQNEQPRPVEMNQNNLMNGQIPSECYPKDVLQSADLLPRDSDSLYAQVNPSGQGAIGDQNFLNTGYHIGINTVGQTLRNPSWDLRSTPPNPQTQVSPWAQSTIEPDINRRQFEIGQ